MHRPLFYPNVTCGTPKCDTDVAQAHHETETQPSLHKLPLFRALLRAPAAPPPGARNMLRPSRGHRPVTKGTVHSSKPFHYKEEEGSEAREGDRGLRLQHARVLVFPFWFAGYFLTSDPCSFFSVFLFFFFFLSKQKVQGSKDPSSGSTALPPRLCPASLHALPQAGGSYRTQARCPSTFCLCCALENAHPLRGDPGPVGGATQAAPAFCLAAGRWDGSRSPAAVPVL